MFRCSCCTYNQTDSHHYRIRRLLCRCRIRCPRYHRSGQCTRWYSASTSMFRSSCCTSNQTDNNHYRIRRLLFPCRIRCPQYHKRGQCIRWYSASTSMFRSSCCTSNQTDSCHYWFHRQSFPRKRWRRYHRLDQRTHCYWACTRTDLASRYLRTCSELNTRRYSFRSGCCPCRSR
jgi:hypothetical protein